MKKFIIIAEEAGVEAANVYRDNVGYLHNYTIRPGHSMSGHLMAKDNPNAKHLLVDIPLGSRVYRFVWQLR